MATGPKGERHLCGSCGTWHAQHRPDNCIAVPICPECWRQISINTRVWALSLASMTSTVSALDNSIHELLDGVVESIAATQSQQPTHHNN
jgi:hypothetical protein